MASRPPNLVRRPPAPKRFNPAHAHYGTQGWKATRLRIKERDGWQCTRPDCRTPNRGRGGRLIVDHIVPRSEGGTDDDDNLRVLCSACDAHRHREKGSNRD